MVRHSIAGKLLLVGTILAAAFAWPALASAATLCVNKPGCLGASYGVNDLQTAFNDAAGTPAHDTIEIGPGLYDDGPYGYSGATSSAEIVGAGESQTTLTAPANAASQKQVSVHGSGTSVSDLTVLMPAAMSSGDDGLHVGNDALAKRVTVNGAGTDNTDGVILEGSTFAEGTVTMPLTAVLGNRGIYTDGQATVIRDSDITAQTGITRSTEVAQAEITRTRIQAGAAAVTTDAGVINISHGLIDLEADARGLVAENTNDATLAMTINANHVTIVSDGGSSSVAVRAVGNSTASGEDATVNFDNSVASGTESTLVALADNGESATVRTQYSNYDAALNFEDDDIDDAGATGSASIIQANQTNHPPAFVNPATGDFRLQANSMLVDAAIPGSPDAADLDGNPRPADGNGDHAARADVGAYELPDTFAPPVSIDSGPAGETTDAQPAFLFSSGDGSAMFQCRFDDAPFAPCTDATAPSGSHAASQALALGPHTFQVRALDAVGNVGAPMSRSFTVIAQPGGGGGGGGGGGDGNPVDDDSPDTIIRRTRIRGDDVVIRFVADEQVSGFFCKRDRGPYRACASPKRLRNLDDGTHRFRVFSIDLAGNVDPKPARSRFAIED